MEIKKNLLAALLSFSPRDLVWAIALAICLFGWNRTIEDGRRLEHNCRRIESEMDMRLHDVSMLYDSTKAELMLYKSPFPPGTFPQAAEPKETSAAPPERP